MYETHFGFHRQPFHAADASRAFFVSESIGKILPQMLHALRSDLGIAVLTGVPGSGKTSLLRHIQQQLSHEGRVIVCSGASLGTSVDLIGVLLEASHKKAGRENTTKSNAADSVLSATRSYAMEHMRRTAELWGPILLLIDDVQLVPLAVLNELRACTEEEWNGRDLVRCLVSAPISFEEQLARSEYAEFGRRIRCHAFLQPLKTGESIRFLQEQLEFAGGRLSQVLTTSALELIATAAAGIPRCLSLLADETFVVAAECGEKTATEKSVRTALSRLQHLQYNWNASPEADDSAAPLLDDEDTAEESISQVPAATVPVPVSRPTPTHATLARGVIEFGGPARAAVDVRLTTPDLARSQMATGTSAVEATLEVAVRQTDTFSSLTSQPTQPSVCEFGITTAVDFIRSERMAIRNEGSASFEVGRRFFAESSEDSISMADVDSSDLVNLLNLDGEIERASWGVVTFPETALALVPVAASSLPPQSITAEIVWIDGQPELSETTPTGVAIAVNEANLDDASVFGQRAEIHEGLAAIKREFLSQRAVGRIVATPKSTANCGFIDLSDSRMSNRTPVFDRYTWIALGREVPPGACSLVSQTKSKQLFLADCGMLATSQLPTRCLQTASGLHMAAINQIPISDTTDAILLDEIQHHAPRWEENTFDLLGNAPYAAHAIPHQVPAQVNHYETPFRHDALVACDALLNNEASPVFSGLKIWHDGQLIVTRSPDSDSPSAENPSVQRFGTLEDPLDEADRPHPEPATKLDQGEFLTLPVPIGRVDLAPQSPVISSNQDLFSVVESIASLQSDVRQFQQTDSNSGVTEPVFEPDAELTPESATLISRAKRRLDERAAVTNSAVVALQITPDARTKRTVLADSEMATSNSESTPQFSRLFTRLWENRKRAVAEADR